MAYCLYFRAENILNELKNCQHLRRMEYTMLSLKAFLMDAEEKQEQSCRLRNWLKEVEKVFSQMEDVIDDYKQKGIGTQVLAPFLYCNRTVKKLCHDLDTIASEMYKFNLKERHTASIKMETTKSFLSATEVSTALMKPSWQFLYPLTNAPKVNNICGDFLNDFKRSTHGFFHIVGDAGTGKSRLAKFLYNDSDVVRMFSSRLWVCVKKEFDTQRLIKEMHSFSYCPATGENLTDKQLFSGVKQCLRQKTFLLVFQDLSIQNLDNRSMLKHLLSMGNRGSKIIVTTQNEEIADAIGLRKVYKAVPVTVTKEPSNINNDKESIQAANPPAELEAFMTHQTIFKVGRLSEENSLSLYTHYASRDPEKAKEMHVDEITLVKNCRGVPLVIKCLGSLVSSATKTDNKTYDNWNTDVYNIQKKEKEFDSPLAVLRSCYDRLASHLKPCFLYCSQLPNDHILSSNDVIQLWMAQGLLDSPEEKYLSLENIGENYFKELWSRCFFQDIEEHGLGYWFKMHPLIQKLADVLAQEQNESSKDIKPVTIAFRVREKVAPSASLADKCISKFKFLRQLYLGNTNLEEIPNAIGTLKVLRYLDLQGNRRIKRLPNSICNLQSLETLILASCSELQKLPKCIRKLTSLRYLWVTTNKLHLHKNGVGTMTSLRFLAIGGCENLQDLFERPSCLVRLETLMIYDCNTLKLLPNEMRLLISLQNLVIWSCKQLTLTLAGVEFRLRRFTIRELPEVDEFPEWLQGSTETLRVLEISDCPIKILEDAEFKTYKALEKISIHGAVRVKQSTGEYAVEHWNSWRVPSKVKNEMKFY